MRSKAPPTGSSSCRALSTKGKPQGQTYFVYVSSAEQAGVHTRLTVSMDPSATVASSLLHESSANSVTVQTLPAGQQPVITRNSNTQLTLQLTGKAVEHESKHRIEGITVTIPKGKVVGAISNVVSSPFGIAFTDTEAIVRDVPQDLNVAAGHRRKIDANQEMATKITKSSTHWRAPATWCSPRRASAVSDPAGSDSTAQVADTKQWVQAAKEAMKSLV
ncbi:hypothetical protein [Brevibacillus centrosporus]|uniref:hypothetical protein n=1 Tax=Brevibacillus centrosporus TaxID=54910 RepID=UPI0039869ECC